jgi:hypothetical protein
MSARLREQSLSLVSLRDSRQHAACGQPRNPEGLQAKVSPTRIRISFPVAAEIANRMIEATIPMPQTE